LRAIVRDFWLSVAVLEEEMGIKVNIFNKLKICHDSAS